MTPVKDLPNELAERVTVHEGYMSDVDITDIKRGDLYWFARLETWPHAPGEMMTPGVRGMKIPLSNAETVQDVLEVIKKLYTE